MMAGVVPNPGPPPASAMQQKLIDVYKKDMNYFDFRKREPSHIDVTTYSTEIYKLPHLIVADGDQHHVSDGPEIRCCEDMFYNDKEPCRDIYITGYPGMGKTSLCQYMSLLWTMCKEGKTVINRRMKKDAKFLASFDFLFFIKLRETNQTDIIDILVDSFLDPKSLDERTSMCRTMKETLQCNTCLVILDGLDEWAPDRNVEIPSRPSGSTCVVLTTSRPYRYDSVRLTNMSIDLHVKLMELHRCSVESIVFEYLKYKEFENKSAHDFFEEAQYHSLDGLLCNPLMTMSVLEIWCSQPFFSLSRAQVYGNLVDSLFGKSSMLPMHLEYVSALGPQSLLLGILSNYEHLNKHRLLLQKISLFAFVSLFNNDVNRTNLVFTGKELTSMPYFLSYSEITFLCSTGILSRNIVCRPETKICFFHHSFVNFFAAVFLASFDVERHWYSLKKPTSITEILQHSDFLLFCAGMASDKNEYVFDQINKFISDQLKTCRKNVFCRWDPFNYQSLTRSLQNLVISCYNEGSKVSHYSMPLKLEDCTFDGSSDDKVLKTILLLNETNVKSIHSVQGKYFEEFNQISDLEGLHIGNVVPDDYIKFTECMSNNSSTLCTVSVKGHVSSPLIPELSVRTLKLLTSLSVFQVTMKHASLESLVKFVSDNVLIENIELSLVHCDDHNDDEIDCDVCKPPGDISECTLELTLEHHTKLTSVCLDGVNIVRNSLNSVCLKSLTLWPFHDDIAACYDGVINCIKSSKLEHLYINGRQMLDSTQIQNLISAIETLQCLKSITLREMKLTGGVLLLHECVKAVEIVLKSVKMSRAGYISFIENDIPDVQVDIDSCFIPSSTGVQQRVSYTSSKCHMYK